MFPSQRSWGIFRLNEFLEIGGFFLAVAGGGGVGEDCVVRLAGSQFHDQALNQAMAVKAQNPNR